jgi:hypothetical protein
MARLPALQWAEEHSVKIEYHEGPEARKNFEQGMTKLFKVKKTLAKETPRAIPKRKQGKTSKG